MTNIKLLIKPIKKPCNKQGFFYTKHFGMVLVIDTIHLSIN
jgi:hypothetical protein